MAVKHRRLNKENTSLASVLKFLWSRIENNKSIPAEDRAKIRCTRNNNKARMNISDFLKRYKQFCNKETMIQTVSPETT